MRESHSQTVYMYLLTWPVPKIIQIGLGQEFFLWSRGKNLFEEFYYYIQMRGYSMFPWYTKHVAPKQNYPESRYLLLMHCTNSHLIAIPLVPYLSYLTGVVHVLISSTSVLSLNIFWRFKCSLCFRSQW